MAKPFTDKLISSLKPTDKKIYIREGRGFTVQVMPSGVKTFLYIYTFEGKRKHLNLGTYPQTKLAEARQKYSEAYSLVSKGIDPQAAAAQAQEDTEENLTFGYFAELYLAHSQEHHTARWHKTIKGALTNDVLPHWKDTPIASIRRRDSITLLEKVAQRGVQVVNVHKATSSVFDYALQREYIDANPLLGLNKKIIPALEQRPRERTLSDNEIREVWRAIDEGPGFAETKRALKLILVTAQRPGEVAGLHRREIEGHWWTIPAERAEKGKRDHMVHLTPTALKLIGDTEGYIFSSPQEDQPINRNSLSQLVSRNRSNLKDNKPAKLPFYGLERWTPHDLRRTARTFMAKIGIPDEHAEAVLNHAKQGVIKVYNRHDYQEEKKQALIKWEEELLKIIEPLAQDTLSETDPLANFVVPVDENESPNIKHLSNQQPAHYDGIDPLTKFTPPTPLPDGPLFKNHRIKFETHRTAIDPLTQIDVATESEKRTNTEEHANIDPLAS